MQSLFLWNGYLLRVRYRIRLPFVVGRDGSKPTVSCLKIEPVVSIFPVI